MSRKIIRKDGGLTGRRLFGRFFESTRTIIAFVPKIVGKPKEKDLLFTLTSSSFDWFFRSGNNRNAQEQGTFVRYLQECGCILCGCTPHHPTLRGGEGAPMRAEYVRKIHSTHPDAHAPMYSLPAPTTPRLLTPAHPRSCCSCDTIGTPGLFRTLGFYPEPEKV